jgi:transcriptional regulator of acetoin/glycerol metabolism
LRTKLESSKAWLHRKYVVERKTPEQIAEQAGVSAATIYRRLKEFGLLK